MAEDLEPLIWKITEKGEKDDIWPKKNYGGSLVYLKGEKKYFFIGGNFDAYQNELSYFQLNNEIISTFESGVSSHIKAINNKMKYIEQNLSENYYSNNVIDLYVYELEPEPHWFKMVSSGLVPKAKSCHQCIYIQPYIFLFGGVEMGQKSENLSSDELFVLNTKTFVWKKIITDNTPYNRTDFKWVSVENIAFLYGGCSSPSEKFYDDLWMFTYNYENLFDNDTDVKKDIALENIWTKLKQSGKGPGKLKAYGMEHYKSNLFIFGGIDNKNVSNNNMFKYDINSGEWEKVETKGYPPCPRSYHNMSLINSEMMVIFGGIVGTLRNTKDFLNDVYLFNLKESVWVIPVIGGLVPSPRIGCGYTCNYEHDKMGIMILGGFALKENDPSDKKNFMKIYFLTENDKNSHFFWTIRNIKYKEEENDDNFLLQTEKDIHEFKDKIANLEMDTQNKEILNEKMKKEITEHKKEFFQQNGFIEDQSQSLEEQINDQEEQKVKMEEHLAMDKEITELKRKLKFVMEKKTEKTMKFFNETCSIFLNYYDAVNKIIANDHDEELIDLFPSSNLNNIKREYCEKLNRLKGKLENYNRIEENIETELHRINKYDKSFNDAFADEIKKYNINDD